jgi:hypothetical protein
MVIVILMKIKWSISHLSISNKLVTRICKKIANIQTKITGVEQKNERKNQQLTSDSVKGA